MEKNDLWKTILAELELEIAKPTFKTFLAFTKLVDIKDNIATISCPNPVISQTIETRYYSLIKKLLDNHTKQNNSLIFKSQKTPMVPQKKLNLPLFNNITKNNDSQDKLRKSGINPLYNFKNFAVSITNQLAFAAATAVAKKPGKAYNPLFIWGGVGVGKTHLMQAVGYEIITTKNIKAIYCTSEEFTNDIINAIQTKTTKRFKHKYRNVNVFLIDDIQFIAGKNTVQQEFFHTFNSIYRLGGQIVLTSDKPPHEISKLEERLRSRFEGGLTIDIAKPDFELRTAILRIKAKQRAINLPMKIAKLIASSIKDTRKLEGTLIRLISESELKNTSISLELAQQILQKELKENNIKIKIPPKRIIKTVAEFYNLTQSKIKGNKRKKEIAVPRQIIMYLLREKLHINYSKIGEILGGRDHTTIMYGVEKISKEIDKNPDLYQEIELIENKIFK